MTGTTEMQQVELRSAVEDDIDAIATIWHRGWRDGHLGHVPAALLPHRGLADLAKRVPVHLDTTTVATAESGVVGFIVTHLDEVDQLYVDASFRGTGVAAVLLRHGETVIGAEYGRAWLAVVAGNARARRFYERMGWYDAGAFDNPAWAAGDTTIAVPARRYEKDLRAAHR